MASRAIPSPISLIGLDPDFKTAVRGYEKLTINSAKTIEDFIPRLYSPKAFTPKTITFPVYAGIPDAVAWDGKSVITAQGIYKLHDVSATTYLYANAVAYTYESNLFDLYSVNNRLAKELGISAESYRQICGSAFFNDGFATTVWVDGVYFFSASHPRQNGLAEQSNLVSGALAHDTLMGAITAGRTMTDPLGRMLNQKPIAVWVDPSEGETARWILNKGLNLESDSMNNNINPYQRYGIDVVEYPYMDTTTEWWVQFSGPHGPTAFVNNRLPVKLFPQEETPDHGVKQDIAFACAFWLEDYTQFVGSTGV